MAALCLLSACAVGPNFRSPAPPATNHYGASDAEMLSADGATQTVEPGGAVDPAWWRLFGSPALDALVTDGLKHSPTLVSARAALGASGAQARAGAGVFFPSVSGSFAATRERIAPAQFDQSGPGSTFSLYTLAGSVGYALDLFGGERRAYEALRAQATYQRHALGAARLLLTGNIVDAAIAHAGYADEAATLADIVHLDQDLRDIAQAQFKSGQAAWSAVLLAEQQLDADRQSLTQVDQKLAASTTLLGTLTGREPAEALPPLPVLDELRVPAAAPVSLPSRLVRQRPDILEAEATMHEASAQVGVATAALFPSIDISGDYGATSTALSRLAGPAARFWSIGPSVDVPIFRGGALWFGRKAAQQTLLETQAGYRQTVLTALEQVADQLEALDVDAANARAGRAAFDAARENQTLASANLTAGVIAGADAMAIQSQALRERLVLIAVRTQRLQDVVGLYIACGGGWTGHEEDAPAEAAAGR